MKSSKLLLFTIISTVLFSCASKHESHLNDKLMHDYFKLIANEKFQEAKSILDNLQEKDGLVSYTNELERDKREGGLYRAAFSKTVLINFIDDLSTEREELLEECKYSPEDFTSLNEQILCLEKKLRHYSNGYLGRHFRKEKYHSGINMGWFSRCRTAEGLVNDRGCYLTGVNRKVEGMKKRVNGPSDFLESYANSRLDILKKIKHEAEVKQNTELQKKDFLAQQAFKAYEASPSSTLDKLCKYKKDLKFVTNQIEHHKEVGRRSGFVNAVELNKLSHWQVQTEKMIDHYTAEYKQRTGKSPNLKQCVSGNQE